MTEKELKDLKRLFHKWNFEEEMEDEFRSFDEVIVEIITNAKTKKESLFNDSDMNTQLSIIKDYAYLMLFNKLYEENNSDLKDKDSYIKMLEKQLKAMDKHCGYLREENGKLEKKLEKYEDEITEEIIEEAEDVDNKIFKKDTKISIDRIKK